MRLRTARRATAIPPDSSSPLSSCCRASSRFLDREDAGCVAQEPRHEAPRLAFGGELGDDPGRVRPRLAPPVDSAAGGAERPSTRPVHAAPRSGTHAPLRLLRFIPGSVRDSAFRALCRAFAASYCLTVGIEVRLLGGFSATVDGGPVPERAWRLRKARTLVKLLALASRRTLHRGQVVDLLWPEHEPPRAANNLDQAVHAARRALGASAIAVHDELLTLAASCEVDVDAFEAAAAAARTTGTQEALEAAVGLFAGDLLPDDRYQPWTEP